MKITTIDIGLAKEVLQIHGEDEHGKEACGGAHHWARKFGGYGHTVKLMASQFVKL